MTWNIKQCIMLNYKLFIKIKVLFNKFRHITKVTDKHKLKFMWWTIVI